MKVLSFLPSLARTPTRSATVALADCNFITCDDHRVEALFRSVQCSTFHRVCAAAGWHHSYAAECCHRPISDQTKEHFVTIVGTSLLIFFPWSSWRRLVGCTSYTVVGRRRSRCCSRSRYGRSKEFFSPGNDIHAST